jgi:hypothetical protein
VASRFPATPAFSFATEQIQRTPEQVRKHGSSEFIAQFALKFE